MGTFIEAAMEGDVADGVMKEVTVEGRKILLTRVGGRYYAAEGHCPHMGATLANGTLEGTVVTCPRHGSQFDLADGRMVRWAQMPALVSAIGKAIKKPRGINTLPVKVEAGRILVQV